jgi:hypothetical protein
MSSTPSPDAAREAANLEWDRLATALNAYGITHLAPGQPAVGEDLPTDPVDLFYALAVARSVRLQEAAIPLLLTYPELADAAQSAIDRLDGVVHDRAQRRYVAACALQRMWRSRLQLALGEQPLLRPAYIDEMGLPSLEEDYGRLTLRALAAQEEALYGYNAWAGYTSLMDLLLNEIERRSWGRRARAS